MYKLILVITISITSCLSASVYVVTPEKTYLESSTPDPEVEGRMASDLVFAEFKPGAIAPKNGRPGERMLSVKEMLSKEVIAKKASPISTTTKPRQKVEDVWDIIKHNQEQELQDLRKSNRETKKPTTTTKAPPKNKKIHRVQEKDVVIETIPSISLTKKEWNDEFPNVDKIVNTTEIEERPRNIETSDSWGYSYQNLEQDKNYYPESSQAQDRFNPAQPYLPPRPSSNPQPVFKPQVSQPSLPPPPVPMPPPPLPPTPKDVMSAPPMTYDSFPPYPPSGSSDSGPPPPTGDFSGYPPPPDDDDSPPPSYDDHHHHHHHHDDSYKFVQPSPDIDLESLQHFYHDHLHHHHVPATTTTTTPKPEIEDQRVNNRYSYYYLGKKLWYLPLYFSVYFIIYVAVLIIRSIARHKITYPQHYKNKRSLDTWKMSPEDMNNLTRFVGNALINYGLKYLNDKL